MKKILRGWKEIEDFLGISRKTIVAHGFPVRKTGRANSQIYAFKGELLRHLAIHNKGKNDDP